MSFYYTNSNGKPYVEKGTDEVTLCYDIESNYIFYESYSNCMENPL